VRSRTFHAALVAAALQGGGLAAGAAASAQAPGATGQAVTLEEARARAEAVDPAAVAARNRLETAGWERRQALADLVTPRISAGTNFTRFSEPFFNFGTGDISSNATSATLQASYSVLGTGKRAALRRSAASIESAEASETASRFRTALATDAAYYAVLANGELARVAADRLARAQEQFAVARVRVLAGEAIAPDSLQLLLEMNRARLAVLSRDSELAVARLRLGSHIGLDGPADAAPVDESQPAPLPLSLGEAVEAMLANGPDIQATRALERQADAVLGAERAGYLPDITLDATTGAYDSEFFPSAFKRTQFGLTVSLPIWDGGQRELDVARAREARETSRAEREHSERTAETSMAEVYLGYETARSAIELALIGVAASAESYRVQSARYREGATTILDLVEAQVALTEAEATLVQARYDARLALARIETLLGRRLFESGDPES
jgi:outer membrane protein TolC